MPLLQRIRSLFTRTPPRKVRLAALGEFTEHCPGMWYGQAKLEPNGQDMGILFKTGGATPGEREAAFWRGVSERWPNVWPGVVDALRRDLYFESTEEAAAFLGAVRPTGFVFHDLSPGAERWEIDTEPDYSEHLLQVFMRGMSYDTYGQDG